MAYFFNISSIGYSYTTLVVLFHFPLFSLLYGAANKPVICLQRPFFVKYSFDKRNPARYNAVDSTKNASNFTESRDML